MILLLLLLLYFAKFQYTLSSIGFLLIVLTFGRTAWWASSRAPHLHYLCVVLFVQVFLPSFHVSIQDLWACWNIIFFFVFLITVIVFDQEMVKASARSDSSHAPHYFAYFFFFSFSNYVSIHELLKLFSFLIRVTSLADRHKLALFTRMHHICRYFSFLFFFSPYVRFDSWFYFSVLLITFLIIVIARSFRKWRQSDLAGWWALARSDPSRTPHLSLFVLSCFFLFSKLQFCSFFPILIIIPTFRKWRQSDPAGW